MITFALKSIRWCFFAFGVIVASHLIVWNHKSISYRVENFLQSPQVQQLIGNLQNVLQLAYHQIKQHNFFKK